MNKKTTIILVSVAAMAITMVIGILFNRALHQKMRDTVIDQYAAQEMMIAKQTAKILEEEVTNIQDKLNLIASLPEVKNGNTDVCNQKLQEAFALMKKQVGNLGRIDEQGIFRCSLNKALVGIPGKNLGPYVTDIFNDPEHKPVMSRIILPPGANSYVIAVHIPVRDAAGKFIGTLGGAIYLNDIKERYLHNIQLADQGYLALRDDNGDLLYHPNESFVGKNVHSAEFAALSGRKGPPQDVDSKKSGTLRYEFDGKERVAAFVHAKVLPGRYWAVVMTVPIEEIEQTVLNTSVSAVFPYIYLLITAASILPSIVLLLYLLHALFRPLRKIGDSIRQMGEGNQDVHIPVNGNAHDEISTVARAFNLMSDRIRASYKELENKVEGRTKELQESKTALEQKLKELEQTNDLMTDRELKMIELKKRIAELEKN